MDFFEKAHVVRNKLSHKNSKSAEAMKKQIKQMLFGYKQSDFKLIKTCEDAYDPKTFNDDSFSSVSGFSGKESPHRNSKSEESMKKEIKQMLFGYQTSDGNLLKTSEDAYGPKTFNDDSSSVSGFSDLNLTNSSIEADTTRGTVGSDDGNISDVDEVVLSNISDSSHVSQFSNDSSQIDTESISEYGVNNLTLSDDASEIALESSSETSNGLSLKSSFSDAVSEKDSGGTDFDPERELATKILEKLGKRKLFKKIKKRRLDPEFELHEMVFDLKSKQKLRGKKKKQKADTQKELLHNKDEEYCDDTSENTNSADFISIEASDMPDQSLGDILGEYRHPTMRNLPSDIQVTNSTNNFNLNFTIEEMNVEDIQIQEEVGSLTPEYDSTIDENDIDSTDIDMSVAPITKDTSVYDDTIQSEPTSETEVSLVPVDDTFECPVKYYYGDNRCIFVLKHPAELYIQGKVIIKALGGTIDLFGYRLNDEPCEVYAPNYNFAHCIKTVESQNLYNGLFSKLTAEGLSVTDAEEIVTKLGENDGVISLKKLYSRKSDFVENNMTNTDLFSKINKNIDACFKKVSEFLGCSLYLTRQWKTFEEVTCWRKVAEHGFKVQSRGIVCGGKGVGKSTFLRYCVNRLLSQGPVLVVDLDPGQAEFTVAGNISATVVDKPLLGPNFSHLKTPQMMLNLGMINTMDNPRRYAAAVGALISHCCNNEQLKSMPWIINTMGLCNAMGLKFMTLTILQAQPTYLLQIDSKNAKKRFEMYLDSYTTRKLYQEDYKNDPLFKNLDVSLDFDYSFFVAHHTENPVKKSFSLPARDERYLNFLAYFGDLVTSKELTDLLGIVPYEVKLEDLHIGLNVKISGDAVTKVINGKIIALCQLMTQDKGGDVFTLRDKPVLCHGHGLIRGVDFEKQTLYIITPIEADKLALVNTLVYADWVPEMRGQERKLLDGISVPYRTASMYQKRQLMFAPKRRFNPLQLLKMTRNS